MTNYFNPDNSSAKEQLEDYYGTAMASGMPMAVIELSQVENMTEEEAEAECERLGINR